MARALATINMLIVSPVTKNQRRSVPLTAAIRANSADAETVTTAGTFPDPGERHSDTSGKS